MTPAELIELFDIGRVQKAGAVFNQDKFDWLNREYLKKMSDGEIAALLKPMLASVIPTRRRESRMVRLEENWIPVSHGNDRLAETLLVKIIAVERGRASTLNDFIGMGKFF